MKNRILFVEVACVLFLSQTAPSLSQGKCPDDHLRSYCLAKFVDLRSNDCSETNTPTPTSPPPILGSTYIRWGRTTCPNNTGAEAVYSGRAAGPSYTANGGGANMLCLPDDPDYLNRTADTVQGHSPLTGAEYHTWVAREDLIHENAPCVVCYTPRATSLMIPAKTVCPTSWTLEYVGYLTTKFRDQGFMDYACLDKDPEFVPGESAVTYGVTLHLVEATCNTGISCPPYHAGKEVACAVCTK